MKNSAILINTARGEVVDDNALILALKSKEISAVGLDVFNNEPNINPELMKFENAILLPHWIRKLQHSQKQFKKRKRMTKQNR